LGMASLRVLPSKPPPPYPAQASRHVSPPSGAVPAPSKRLLAPSRQSGPLRRHLKVIPPKSAPPTSASPLAAPARTRTACNYSTSP
jgi:hypothetical protein